MKKIVVAILLLLIGVTVSAQNNPLFGVRFAQWAYAAEATSQFGDGEMWSAQQATGAPNVRECADSGSAWASAQPTDGERLALRYRIPVVPTQVNIYQNFNPGAISRIEIIPADGNPPILIDNSSDTNETCPSVFSVNLPPNMPLSDGVIIHLDQTRIETWNEIDAVELVGFTQQTTASPSSIETGDYPEYEFVSNDGRSAPVTARPDPRPYDEDWGTNINCPNGLEIEDAIEVTIIQQRPGSRYFITAIGIGTFDPILALVDNNGNILCNDDSDEAALYTAQLPTTGTINLNNTSSQIIFDHFNGEPIDLKIVVGGFGGQNGEVLLLIEGMVASGNDGVGDVFALPITPSIAASGVPPTAYMLSVVNAFDPLITMIDNNGEPVIDNGFRIECDNAGSRCYGQSQSLAQSFVSRSNERIRETRDLDAMLTLPIADRVGEVFNYSMSGNDSFGDYIAAFHFGITSKPDDE